MHNPLWIEDIEGTHPNKFKHSRRKYQIPIQNPFEGMQRNPYGYNEHPSYPSGPYTYGSPKGNNTFMNFGQNIAYQDNSKLQTVPDMRNPLYYQYSPKLQNSSSKLNLMGSAPQDSLDAFQRDREAQESFQENRLEAPSKSYGVEEPRVNKEYQAPIQEPKMQSPQNLGVSSPKNFSSVKQTERISTDYEEAPQIRNAQYYGMKASSPKRTGRAENNFEVTTNRYLNPTFQDDYQSRPEREASPEDTIKMRNPMFADFNYSKYETDASMRKTRFVAKKDESLELVKKGVTGNYLSYPSQGSAIEKTYGNFYGIVTSPSVSKSFYDTTEAIKNQNRYNQLNNTYSQPLETGGKTAEQLKLMGSVQPRYQQQPYLYQGGQGSYLEHN